MKKKILILHNIYKLKGGEDVVVASENALLRQYGHEVHLHNVSNHSIQGLWRQVTTALSTHYSQWGREEALRVILETSPDIVHVHNFFPLFTPSIYDACHDAGVPVVQTLHNYRTICPGAYLMRDGKPCEDCIQGSPYQAALHGCYRDSKVGSLVVGKMVDYHRRQGTWKTKVDRFIGLTQFSKGKFVEAGFPAEKISVKPNFVEVSGSGTTPDSERKGALFVGRLSPEKGVETLIRAWESVETPLRIVGEGPMLDWAKKNASASVTVLGKKDQQGVAEEMARAAFLVLPSEWYEGFPMTIVEAFSRGLPVIASNLGSMTEIVENNVTGLHFEPGNQENLIQKVKWATEHPEKMRDMGRNANRTYEQNYTPKINYGQLMDIYEEACEEKRRSNA